MKFNKIIIVALVGIMFCMTGCNTATSEPVRELEIIEISENALQGKKVLYVYGGWEGHEPEQCRDIFVPWLKSEGAEVFLYDNLECYDDSVLMASIDLIVQHFTQGKITGSQDKALRNAVKRGVGIAGWHGGTGDSFRNNVDYQYMIGGQWVSHPGGGINYSVQIFDHKDPVTRGLEDFDMLHKTEQYFMHVDPNVKVLATTTFSGEHDFWIDGCVIPVVWKKQYGKGRVFYSSLGHVAQDFEKPEVLEIMQRGIRWASESLEKGPEEWLSPVYKR
jgi:type 1 glutamine amidotransferase